MTKKLKSDYSGTLEITWYDGKKLLNTKNANYSYGALQRILKFGLQKINLDKVNSILILGLGGGSVIETLRNDYAFGNKITAVDIDPIIIEIGKSEFGLFENEKLHILCDDALHFMESNTSTFDLIIVDLFIDIKVPEVFLSLDFWKNISRGTSTNGAVLFNASLEKTKSNALTKVIDFLKINFYSTEIFEKVNGSNTLIISKGL